MPLPILRCIASSLLQRYKYRLIVDESVSLGVLGKQGRGAAEHFGYAPEDVEIVGGSMGELAGGVWAVRSCHRLLLAVRPRMSRLWAAPWVSCRWILGGVFVPSVAACCAPKHADVVGGSYIGLLCWVAHLPPVLVAMHPRV